MSLAPYLFTILDYPHSGMFYASSTVGALTYLAGPASGIAWNLALSRILTKYGFIEKNPLMMHSLIPLVGKCVLSSVSPLLPTSFKTVFSLMNLIYQSKDTNSVGTHVQSNVLFNAANLLPVASHYDGYRALQLMGVPPHMLDTYGKIILKTTLIGTGLYVIKQMYSDTTTRKPILNDPWVK